LKHFIRIAITTALGARALTIAAQSADAVGPVSFELSETRGAPGRAPVMRFVFETVEIHQCATLDVKLSVSGSAIVLGPFTARALTGPCPPTVTPAMGRKDVALANGSYSLSVVNRDTSTFRVEITDARIAITRVRASEMATLRYAAVMRIEPSTFALTCGSPRETADFCPGIVETLSGVAGITAIDVAAGVHGWQQQANGFWVNEPTRYFRYANATALTNAQGLLASRAYSLQKNSGYGLAIAIWDGNTFVP
jgi:hypothetical protein